MGTGSLAGRVALVTGGSRGIGRGIALALARAGADVAINYRREADEAEKVVAEIAAMGRTARAYAASVDDVAACAAMVAAVASDEPQIAPNDAQAPMEAMATPPRI